MIIRPAPGVAPSAARRPPVSSGVPSANVAYLTADGRRMVEARMGLLEATVADRCTIRSATRGHGRATAT